MRIGINAPVLKLTPGACSPWELRGEIADVARVAQTADACGIDHLTCSEHVAVPGEVAGERGGTYWDPLPVFGYLAAVTERIRFATYVLVLGYHHPLEIVKRYGTLDRVCNGRLVLGVGVGGVREEFELLGARFDDRGARANDAIRAIRAAWAQGAPEYHGDFYDFIDVVVEPRATRTEVPIWVGGLSLASLNRAVEFGDGWVPYGLPPAKMRAMLDRFDLPAGFEVVASSGAQIDPSREPAQAHEQLCSMEEAGATITDVHLSADSVAHYCEQVAALAELSGLPRVG